MMTDFTAVPNEQRGTLPEAARRLAGGWLLLGVAALGIAGIFAMLLVVARAPGLGTIFAAADFFRIALVVHVDQSVLIWFLAFGGMLWSLAPAAPDRATLPRRLALGLAAGGCAVIAIAPFAGAGNPLLNNYVPVLQHPLFHAGLLLFGAGVLVQSLVALGAVRARVRWLDEPAERAALTAAVAVLVAIAALAWTWPQLGRWDGHAFFEFLFWGGGHVVQFAYTQLMLAAWITLAAAIGVTLCVPPRVVSVLVLIGVLPLLWVPVIYVLHPVDTVQARQAFTSLMQYGGGIAAIPIGLYVVHGLVRRRGPLSAVQRPLHRALATSVLMFAVGGLLGWLISGVNTVIPAHYHGSIVGVTLALMGLTYHLLPRLGLGTPPPRLAAVQPWVYTTGQLLHVGGLAASGAMGIQRKTAGAAQGLDSLGAKAAMGVMGIGGLLAVIGGILFVLAVIQALRTRPKAPSA
jgi:hypothetical protein